MVESLASDLGWYGQKDTQRNAWSASGVRLSGRTGKHTFETGTENTKADCLKSDFSDCTTRMPFFLGLGLKNARVKL